MEIFFKGLRVLRCNHSFQYKREEESKPFVPSTVHNEKNRTFLTWIFLFFAGFICFFFWEYQRSPSQKVMHQRKIQSLHSFSVSPFLVRIQSDHGFRLTKVRVQFFVDSVVAQNELREESNQYKEHLIYFLSQSKVSDFVEEKDKEVLVEKIKNQVNSFLSNGKVQGVVIESQFMDEGGFHG